MTTGQTIKRVRQSEGMTVQTVSILTGLSERFISYIVSPKAKEVYKLRLLNVGYREIAEKLNITEAGAKSWFWSIKGNIKKMAV